MPYAIVNIKGLKDNPYDSLKLLIHVSRKIDGEIIECGNKASNVCFDLKKSYKIYGYVRLKNILLRGIIHGITRERRDILLKKFSEIIPSIFKGIIRIDTTRLIYYENEYSSTREFIIGTYLPYDYELYVSPLNILEEASTKIYLVEILNYDFIRDDLSRSHNKRYILEYDNFKIILEGKNKKLSYRFFKPRSSRKRELRGILIEKGHVAIIGEKTLEKDINKPVALLLITSLEIPKKQSPLVSSVSIHQ